MARLAAGRRDEAVAALRAYVARPWSPSVDQTRRRLAAIEKGNVDAAMRADDELHGVPVAVAANRALSAVLEQFSPVLRRIERLRFSTLGGRASVARHDELIRLCAAGEAEQAAAVAFDTWHSLPALDE